MNRILQSMAILASMVMMSACSTISQQEFGSSYGMEARQFDDLHVDAFTHAPERAFSRAHLQAPPAVVFAKLADHQNMSEWMPFLDHEINVDHSRSKTPGQSDVGTVRICEFAGDTLVESMRYWKEGHAYAYTVLPGDGNPTVDHLGTITVEPDGNGGSLVSWRQYFEPKPWSLKAKVMPLMIGVVMDTALGNLVEEYGGEVL